MKEVEKRKEQYLFKTRVDISSGKKRTKKILFYQNKKELGGEKHAEGRISNSLCVFVRVQWLALIKLQLLLYLMYYFPMRTERV